MRRGVAFAAAAWLGMAGAAIAGDDPLAPARAVAVQDGGRVKPLETFARESVRLVTDRNRLETDDGGTQDPFITLLLWCAKPAEAGEAKLIRVGHVELRAALGLAARDGDRVSFAKLRENDRFFDLVQAAAAKDGPRRSTVDQKALELHASFARLGDLVLGRAPRLVATPTTRETSEGTMEVWLSPTDVAPGHAGAPVAAAWGALCAAAGANADVSGPARELAATARSVGAEHVPPVADLEREVHYYQLNPIGKAMWLYALGAVALFATLPLRARWVPFAAGSLAVGGFLLHGYALWLRIGISGRPPVTNMYESILWCAFTAMAFAFVLEAFLRVRLFTAGGALAAWLGLAFAGGGLMPLDQGISPLVPVLRSNFWLTIHVPTIVASYGAFALAWVLGHVAMGLAAIAPAQREAFHQLSRYIYRAMQIGVLLLAAGTILGGVWAADSWGRFWGWDPKEVGALLALLIYLASLHGRFAGWWHDFGLSVSAVMGFYGVLMAWVGVNMLGVGLHSYGFSQGGPLMWLLLGLFGGDVVFCTWAGVARRTDEDADRGEPPEAEGAMEVAEPLPAAR